MECLSDVFPIQRSIKVERAKCIIIAIAAAHEAAMRARLAPVPTLKFRSGIGQLASRSLIIIQATGQWSWNTARDADPAILLGDDRPTFCFLRKAYVTSGEIPAVVENCSKPTALHGTSGKRKHL